MGSEAFAEQKAAFDHFAKHDHSAQDLFLDEGPYLACVMLVQMSWSWVVWKDGVLVGGRLDWNMDAFQACHQAIECIDRAKGASDGS